MARGKLTDEVKALSKELFGYEITVRELRLLPYILNCLVDNSNIDPAHINAEERKWFAKWRKEERMFTPSTALTVSPDFYDTICKILKVGYCSDMLED